MLGNKPKSKWGAKLMVLFIIFVFVASLFAIYEMGANDEETNSGTVISTGKYNFTIENNYYATLAMVDGKDYKVGFVSNPSELSNFSIESGVADKLLASKKVYVIYDPNKLNRDDVQIPYLELDNVLTNVLGKTTVLAYSKDANPVDPEVPLKTCADASDENGVVEITFGDPGVTLKDNCMVLSGKDSIELRKLGSKLAMWVVGVEV